MAIAVKKQKQMVTNTTITYNWNFELDPLEGPEMTKIDLNFSMKNIMEVDPSPHA